MAKFTITNPSGQPVTVEAPSRDAALDQVLDATGPDVSALGSFGRGAASTFPLGEQAYSGIAGLAEHKPYLQERKELDALQAADKEQNPGARLAGQATGIVAPIALTAGVAAPESILGAAGQGALFGGAFGAGNAIDTTANGGSASDAARDVATGAALGAAGGAAGKGLTELLGALGRKAVVSGTKQFSNEEPALAKLANDTPAGGGSIPPSGSTPPPVGGIPTPDASAPVAGQSKQGFFPSTEELKAEILAGVLGGSPRQLRSLPGKDPVATLNKMGEVIQKFSTKENPLIAPGDRYSDRLNRFVQLQEKSGKTIGDTIEQANVAPLPTDAIKASLLGKADEAFLDPNETARIQKVVDSIDKYSALDKTPGALTFKRLQQLKGNIGDAAFEGKGNPALQAAYHTISDLQDNELEKLSGVINKPAFDDAKDAYQTAARAIPMLRMATTRSLAKGYSSYGTPLAALVTGHPVEAIGHLLKEPLARAANAVAFSGTGGIPAAVGEIPVAAGYRVASRAGMGTVEQVSPTDLQLNHPAMAPWKAQFDKNAAHAKDPGEVAKANAVTDFTLSQRDPAYAKAKQHASENPTQGTPPGSTSDERQNMAAGGVVSDVIDKIKNFQGIPDSTLEGFEGAVKQKPEEPFNPSMKDQLKALLAKQKEQADAE